MAVVAAVLTCVIAPVPPARAAGIFDAISGNEEAIYSFVTTKLTDSSGTTVKFDTVNYGLRSNLRVNYNILPKLNLNAGSTFDKSFTNLSGDVGDSDTELTRFRPYVWLTLRDPILTAAIGYDVAEDQEKVSRQPETSLTRDTWNALVTWRPTDLPTTQARYTRTSTRDGTGRVLDTDQDQYFLKTEYLYGGFNGYYAGTYLQTTDNIRGAEAQQTVHEVKALYSRTFFDGRLTLTTDNRMRFADLTTEGGTPATVGLGTTLALALQVTEGLSALSETPENVHLDTNSALANGDLTTSAGITIAFSTDPGDFTRRNFGLNLGTAQTVNRLFVWVEGFGTLLPPVDISGLFSWEVYTSPDNLTWALHATVPTAAFGPFDRRFQIDFPAVTTRYIKVVVRPVRLPPTIVGVPSVFVTEVQAFFDRTTGGLVAGTQRTHIEQSFRSHSFEARVVLFRTPSLYYRFNGDYQEFEPEGATRYIISNGLFLNHRLTRVFSLAANATYEVGEDRGKTGSGYTYYTSLTAIPLPTLTDSLVLSGNKQWSFDTTTTANSLVLYNTAQLYRGIDVTANVGGVLTSEETQDLPELQRREAYVNLGTTIVPHPSLSLTAYYIGKLLHSSGGALGRDRDTTENRLDLAASFSPFRTLVLTAAANILAESDRETIVQQNYGLSWAPFPDGNLQFTMFYAENRLPDDITSRTIQPTLRWYVTSRRRSYLEASYQLTTTEAPTYKTESQAFTTRLNLLY